MNWTPFFIVGSPRSGTTMLRRLLNRHPQLCVPDETHFIPKLYNPFLKYLQRGQRQEAVDLLNTLPLVQKWNVNLHVDDIRGSEGTDAYARAVEQLMCNRASQDDKPYWGDKTPNYVFAIALLCRLFPEARFVHLYRDGRDVALSIIPLSWGPNNAYCAAHKWHDAIAAWQKARPDLGAKAMELSYEQFCREPRENLRKICDFIGIAYEESILTDYRIREDNSGKWRNRFYMSTGELAAFESVAGCSLQSLGYDTSLDNPTVSLWIRSFAWLDNAYKMLSNRILRRDLVRQVHIR